MFTVVKNQNVISVKTSFSLVHGYVCSGRAVWVYLHTPFDDGDIMSALVSDHG